MLLIGNMLTTVVGHMTFGQMIGDLYERKHFKGADRALQAINGFIDGYGLIDDDLAFGLLVMPAFT
jgi:hypothetical protein